MKTKKIELPLTKPKKTDLPELLSRLQVLQFNIDILEKDLKTQIEAVQGLFRLDHAELPQKINSVLTPLEYFVNVTFENKIQWFKESKKQIKKAGNLN